MIQHQFKYNSIEQSLLHSISIRESFAMSRFRQIPRFLTALLTLIAFTSVAMAQEPAKTAKPPAAKAAEPAKVVTPDTAPAQVPAANTEAAPVVAPSTPAPSPNTPSAPPQQESLLLWIYKAEGIFFFPQLFMSIGLVAMIVLYTMQVGRKEFMPLDFLDGMENLTKEKKYQEAYDLSKSNQSLIGRLLTAGVVRLQTSGGQYPQALEAMQEVGEDEGMKFDHRLSYLAMLANIATMVGLLGTVWGMVAAFMVIAQSDTSPKPSELATGVSQALVTTVWGLLQAIPAIVAHTVIKNRISRMMLETGITAERLLSRFQSLTKPSKSTSSATTTTGPSL
jgi:biopolymer transport protein ExbB